MTDLDISPHALDSARRNFALNQDQADRGPRSARDGAGRYLRLAPRKTPAVDSTWLFSTLPPSPDASPNGPAPSPPTRGWPGLAPPASAMAAPCSPPAPPTSQPRTFSRPSATGSPGRVGRSPTGPPPSSGSPGPLHGGPLPQSHLPPARGLTDNGPFTKSELRRNVRAPSSRGPFPCSPVRDARQAHRPGRDSPPVPIPSLVRPNPALVHCKTKLRPRPRATGWLRIARIRPQAGSGNRTTRPASLDGEGRSNARCAESVGPNPIDILVQTVMEKVLPVAAWDWRGKATAMTRAPPRHWSAKASDGRAAIQ